MATARPAFCSRRAFTLIELLVVMGIVVTLATMAVVFLPRMNDNIKVSSAADQIQGVLVIAKQRAKRDQMPTGVRIVFNGGVATQLQYIQQPDEINQGTYTNGSISAPWVATFSLPQGMDFTQMVSAGDYLLVKDAASIPRQIASGGVSASTLTLVSTTTTPLPLTVATGTPYSILRAPQILSGEAPNVLPTDVVIDQSLNLPALSGDPYTYEIIFAPTGGVMNAAATSSTNLICLYVRDVNAAATAAPALIAIQGRSGLVGAHPVAAGADPYLYAKDPRSSGM